MLPPPPRCSFSTKSLLKEILLGLILLQLKQTAKRTADAKRGPFAPCQVSELLALATGGA